VTRKRDATRDFYVALQQKASHIAAAYAKAMSSIAAILLRHSRSNWG